MYQIVKKRALHETVTLMEVHAPAVARKARPASSSSCASTRRASASR